MAQLFRRRANTLARAAVVAIVLLPAAAMTIGEIVARSPYYTGKGLAPEQPVPFSHQHHVSDLGIDCRYCHTAVEVSSSAGIPPTETCMSCHSQIWTEQEMLAPVRQSLKTNQPLVWQRVNRLPEFVYFNHSIHIDRGVPCSHCHGPVDEMPLTYQAVDLHMDWCLECHRDPARFIRPREEVFNLDYLPPPDADALGRQLVVDYDIHVEQLTDCYICHR